jgi:L-alanine-DL-glutamate epimerase-like enolase superfamily enzyme
MAPRIERIEALPLHMPLARPLKAATALITHRCTVLVRVYAGGVVGECFANNEEVGQAEIIRLIGQEITPRLLGRSPWLVEDCWQAMHPTTQDILRDRRMALRAMACVDAALWDWHGKALGQPLHHVWGGVRESIPVVSMGGYYRADDLQQYHDGHRNPQSGAQREPIRHILQRSGVWRECGRATQRLSPSFG